MNEVTSAVEDKLRKIVVEYLGAEPDQVVAAADFTDDLNADSLDIIEVTMAAEEEFGIEISDDEADKVKTFGDALTLVLAKIG